MHFGKPIDIEDELQAYLNANGIKAFAPPVPKAIDTPCAYVHATGGSERAYVQDVFSISIDCYATSWAQASEVAAECVRLIRDLERVDSLATPVYTSDILTLPYVNSDPSHANLARVTFSASIAARSIR